MTLGYWGEWLVHPGVYLGSETPLWGPVQVAFGAGGYRHVRHHLALLARASIVWRHTFSVGYTIGVGLGLGYLHTWPIGGPLYSVDEFGAVRKQTNWGQPAIMPTLDIGLLGWDFQPIGWPLRAAADVVLFGQYPHNDFVMPHAALHLNATYFWRPGQ